MCCSYSTLSDNVLISSVVVISFSLFIVILNITGILIDLYFKQYNFKTKSKTLILYIIVKIIILHDFTFLQIRSQSSNINKVFHTEAFNKKKLCRILKWWIFEQTKFYYGLNSAALCFWLKPSTNSCIKFVTLKQIRQYWVSFLRQGYDI